MTRWNNRLIVWICVSGVLERKNFTAHAPASSIIVWSRVGTNLLYFMQYHSPRIWGWASVRWATQYTRIYYHEHEYYIMLTEIEIYYASLCRCVVCMRTYIYRLSTRNLLIAVLWILSRWKTANSHIIIFYSS